MRYVKFVSIGIAICLAVFLVLNIQSIMFVIMMGSIAERTVTQTVPSPDGTYEAYVISRDEGALGGDTSVWAKKIKDAGIFQHKEKQLLSGGEWGEEYDLVWVDNDTLIVNGIQKYEMEYLWWKLK